MYRYEDLRPSLFTDDGQRMFLAIRDRAHKLLKTSGAVSAGCLIDDTVGDSWQMLACVDRLVELEELLEVPNPHSKAAQNRLFIATNPSRYL